MNILLGNIYRLCILLEKLFVLFLNNIDKVKEINFNPKFLNKGITYEGAYETFVCKKCYFQKINIENVPDEDKKQEEKLDIIYLWNLLKKNVNSLICFFIKLMFFIYF